MNEVEQFRILATVIALFDSLEEDQSEGSLRDHLENIKSHLNDLRPMITSHVDQYEQVEIMESIRMLLQYLNDAALRHKYADSSDYTVTMHATLRYYAQFLKIPSTDLELEGLASIADKLRLKVDHEDAYYLRPLLPVIQIFQEVYASNYRTVDFDMTIQQLQAMRDKLIDTYTPQQIDHSRLSTQAQQVIKRSDEEAVQLLHNYIGTEHILLALISTGSETLSHLFNQFGITYELIRTKIISILGKGERIILAEKSLTPRAKHLLQLAYHEADELNHTSVQPEHILLSLLQQDKESVACGVLVNLHVPINEFSDAIRSTFI